ncbi:kelch-like 5 protein [Sandaracinus amylolyticus]|uniref:Kelch-like 5 protein n=1 Tax=Sandaracinus amylolyticus TaxID=927083 RepID=A0A0F6WA43_9BACT|nr:kelch-like 5 protein [Sandaracinus amylolyticus]
MLRALASISLLSSLVAGCDCGGDPPGDACESSTDCRSTQECIDGTCVARTDGARPGLDASGDSGGACVDFDGDGRCSDVDCDDMDETRGGPERCDGVDNDCDTRTDEGLVEICGGSCSPSCDVETIPGAGGWMPDGTNSEGVIVDPSGALTLGRTEATSFSVWVANMDDGTVSKMDSRTNRELARYPTVGATAPAGSRPWNEMCAWTRTGGNCPSRTAVDQNFDAYVANRAFYAQGTVTKVANREEDCVDRNANGVIDTSRDLNGDGTIDIATAEFVGVEDECILWTTAVGADNAWPRALAIGVAPPDALVGDVWVGTFEGRQACRLSPVDGSTINCVAINNLQPYGAVSDSMGRIWFVDRSGARRDILGYVDAGGTTFTPAAPVPDAGFPPNLQAYGITVDADGRIYIASSASDPPILRYDPATMTWESATLPLGGTPRGVAADEMYLWVGISHESQAFTGALSDRVEQLRLSDLSHVATHRIPTGRQPVGVGVSFDGSVWAICQGTNSASRLDPMTGAWIEHGVGLHPYTYSDFIGFGLNVFAEPRGRYRFRQTGCEAGEFGSQRWLGARVNAEIPASTEVTLWVRVGNTPEEVEAATFIGPFPAPIANFAGPPGPIPQGRIIEVEIRLVTMDRRVAPRVMSIELAGECTGS